MVWGGLVEREPARAMATTKRIAIVDSPTVMRDGLATALGRLGYHVAIISDHGAQYIRASRECPVDLVLLNVGPYPPEHEPAMHGLATLGWIKSQPRRVPVLALSDHPGADLACRVFKAGARGFERREMEAAVLHRASASLLRGELYANDHLETFHNSAHRPALRPGPSAQERLVALPAPQRALFDAVVREPRINRERLAVILDLSVNTVKTHMRHLFASLGVKNRAELLLMALDLGLLRPQDADTGNKGAGGKPPERAPRRAPHAGHGHSARAQRPATRA